jgi:hypothetical protein
LVPYLRALEVGILMHPWSGLGLSLFIFSSFQKASTDRQNEKCFSIER